MTPSIEVPVIEKNGTMFLLLNKISKKWHVRAYKISKTRKVSEKSNHRIKEVTVEKSVKCYSTGAYDISNYKPEN